MTSDSHESMILFLLACQSDAKRFQTIDIQAAEYQIVEQEIPSLISPKTMEGELGRITSGGVFSVSLEDIAMTYKYGREIDLQYQVRNDVLYPLDRDGLILLSFYSHLESVRTILEETELEVEQVFPVNSAITPTLSDITLAIFPFENAAYVPGSHHFIILSDLIEKEVPLAANKGVVAHEFGHAVFHWLTTGGTETKSWGRTEADASNSLASLDEGLADVLGALVTEQSNFISYSLDLSERDLAGEQTLQSVDVLPEDFEADGTFDLYDPYPLGSVFAAMVWDVYLGGIDRVMMLDWVFRTTQTFAEENSDEESLANKRLGYLWLNEFVVQAETEEAKNLACQAIELRFGEGAEVPECS